MSNTTPSSDRIQLTVVWTFLLVLVGAVTFVSLNVGTGDLADPMNGDAYLRLRTYRLINSFIAGAALSAGGVLVQGLFRNPLASPSILGTTAGASLGGIAVLMLWNLLLASRLPAWLPPEMILPIGCVLGSLISLGILLFITQHSVSQVTILLTGFILSSLFLSVGSLFLSLAQDTWELGRAVVAFTLGGVETKGEMHIAFALPLVGVGALAASSWSTSLDVLLSGEDEAASLGVDVRVVRRWVIIWTAVLTGAAVAVGGNLAFVGLVVPHALRPFVGVQHGRLLPASIVGGGVFVAMADICVRLMPVQGTVPLGVVTGLIGAPIFLSLLVRSTRLGEVA